MFSPEDVAAFRLRPLGYIGGSSSFAATTPAPAKHVLPARSSTCHPPPSLPALSNASAKASTAAAATTYQHPSSRMASSDAPLQHAASYPTPNGSNDGEKKAKMEAEGDVRAIQVPSAAVPRVYAALVPAAAEPLREVSAQGGDDAGRSHANISPCPLNDQGSSRYSAHSPSSDSLVFSPVLASADIPAPSLRPAEIQELTTWARRHPVITTYVNSTAAQTSHASISKPTVSVAAAALIPVETAVLHRWWRERQQVRLRHRLSATLYRDLSSALEEEVRSTLTTEEAYWQQQQQQQRQHGSMSSAPANTAVPAGKMELLMRAVQLRLHQAATSFLEAQLNMERKDTEEDHRDSTAAPQSKNDGAAEVNEADALEGKERVEVLRDMLAAERELAGEIKTAASVMTCPSIITLPPEAPIPPPVLRLETAVGVTLLARVLEQAESNTPGIAFANHLLHHYLLPHIYIDLPAWMAVRPQMGGLSEQVTHLATLPLRVQQQRDVVSAAAQAQGDTRYLESVVRAWTMRSWLRCVASERQRVARCALFERAFDRLHQRLCLQRGFVAWQRRMRRRQQQRQESKMEAEFHNFLVASHATTGLEGTAKKMLCAGPVGLLPWASASTAAVAGATAAGSGAATPAQAPSPSMRSRHTSFGSKKRGAGHSRVYLSFLRQKPSAPSLTAASSLTTVPPKAVTADGEKNNTRDCTTAETEVERFVVRNSDSEDFDSDGDADRLDDEDNHSGDGAERCSRSIPASFKSLKSNGGGSRGISLMYLDAPKPSADVAFPSFLGVDDGSTAPTLPADDRGRPPHDTNDTVVTAAPSPLFNAMMTKLQEMEQVNVYLRKELSVQSRRLRKVDTDNNGLRQRNAELEEGMRRLVREKLEACNAAQQHNAVIAEKNRQIRQLRSRLRAHRHRPWQQTVMRLIGDVCAVSTEAAERADEARIRHDRFGTGEGEKSNCSHNNSDSASNHNAGVGAVQHPTSVELTKVSESAERAKLLQQQTATSSSVASGSPSLLADAQTEEEERLFGRIAPIILKSTRQLPEARVILADWANSCLDDLQRLDDLNSGGALAVRFVGFNEEVRSGVLLSRLLYYLALPRYRAQTSAADASVVVPKSNTTIIDDEEDNESPTADGNWTGMDPRRQLLEQHGVQLDPPYPVYEDCFGDILALAPVDRMLQLLAFATELMASQAGDPVNLTRGGAPSEDIFAAMSTVTGVIVPPATKDRSSTAERATGGPTLMKNASADGGGAAVAAATTQPAPQPAAPLPLHSVVDPYALARGEASAVITFVALLYVRFSHPFHHKSRLCALQERRMLLQLWSNGDATAEELAGPLEHSRSGDSLLSNASAPADALPQPGEEGQPAATAVDHKGTTGSSSPQSLTPPEKPAKTFSMEAEMLRQLIPEDKTPWQLFRERCLPVFGTQAHPFLLRGGFWPAEAFDTPELAAMLGALAMALHRSLELHRWHVTLSCLVPVRTYSGLSRGVFTGPHASAAALELGLRQDGQEWLQLDFPLVRQCVEVRQHNYEEAAATAVAAAAAAAARTGSSAPVGSPLPPFAPVESQAFEPMSAPDEIRALLAAVTSVWQEDLLSLFTQRATLSPQLALPVLDLGGWRLLCNDMALIDMSVPEEGGDEAAQGGADPRLSPQERRPPFPSAAPPRMRQRAVDMEVVTTVFQRAVMTVARQRDEVDPAVFDASPHRSLLQSLGSPPLHDMNGEVGKDTVTSRVTVPDIQMDMTYAAFILALALLANEIFPGAYSPSLVTVPLTPLSTAPQPITTATSSNNDNNGDHHRMPASPEEEKEEAIPRDPTDVPPTSMAPQYCSLPMAFAEMMRCVVLASPLVHLNPNDPSSVLRRLTCGVPTQVVLQRHAPALLLVYQAYSKDVFGEQGLLREDMLRLLRDAMLTSAELSQYIVFDLFASCAVLRQAREEAAANGRRDADGRLRRDAGAAARKPGYKAVRIVDPSAASDNTAAAAAQRKRAYVLTFEGFCDLVCVLCSFKQPNVFVPFEERLTLFLRRSLLRPLTHTVPGLGVLLAQSQSTQEVAVKDSVVNAEAPAAVSAMSSTR